MTSTNASGKDGVMSLAERPGGDVSARLLLALTALYAERTNHTADEEEQYTELALRLIERVDAATRMAVATILRERDLTPVRVCGRLDALQVADTSATDLPSRDSVFSQRLPHGDDLLGRPISAVPATSMQDALAPTFHPTAPPAVQSERALIAHAAVEQGSDEHISGRNAQMNQEAAATAPAELAKAFFAAAPAERLSILAQIGGGADAAPALDPTETRRRCDALDVAAMEGRIGEFIREFERLLSVPKSLCERIVNDSSGEPMVVAAKAVDMPAAVLQRVLLLVNPAVGRSVQRVFHLTDLYHDLDRATAARLLSLWSAEAPPNPEVRPDVPARKPREMGAGVTALAGRFGALGERISEVRRSARESVVQRDHRSR